jgi:V8-like Glu-specific endopeptidase
MAAWLVLVLLLAGGAIGYVFFSRTNGGGGGGADDRLAKVAEAKAGAVGFVVAFLPDGSGTTATAWAIGPNLYATNAHVVAAVAEVVEAGGQAQVRVNRNPNLRFPVVGVGIHPRYGDTPLGFDVGLLVIEGTAPAVFEVADAAELQKLASGYRVAYLGFPSENLVGGNVKATDPIATMQSGIVTSVSDFELGDSGFERNQLIRHNLAAVGGASGSPVFNAEGKVVAILNAGNVTAQISLGGDGAPKVERAPSAALVNFAQRVDLLKDIQLQ